MIPHLLIAALELFIEHGYDAASVGQIAARADVTEMTFFRHFPGIAPSLRLLDFDVPEANRRLSSPTTTSEEFVVDCPEGRPAPTTAQEIALWISGALLTLACFGFLPRLTTGLESLDLHGHDSEALLFGLFHVSVAHNIIHLLLGAAALLTAGSRRRCRTFLTLAGTAILLTTLYGQANPTSPLPGLLSNSTPDAVLHIVLGTAMLLTGLAARARP